MKITVVGESTLTTLDLLAKITGSQHAHLEIRDKDIFISATGNSKSLRYLVEGVIEEKGKEKGFGFNIFSLQNILRGRKEIELTFDGSDITFRNKSKGSKFYGDFKSIPFEKIDIAHSADSSISIKGPNMAALTELVKYLTLENHFTSDNMNVFIKLDQDGTFATVYDDFHLAYGHNPKFGQKQKVELSLTLPMFALIESVAKGDDYVMSLSPTSVSASGLAFELSIPLLQGIESQSFDQAKTLVDQITTRKSKHQVSLTIEDINQMMTNLSAVNDGSAGIEVATHKGHIKFSLASTFGKAIEVKKIPADWGKTKYVINQTVFTDIMRVCPAKEVNLSFYESMVVLIVEVSTIRLVYTCVLM